MQEIRALVVDDFEGWRQAICAALQRKLGLCMIEETKDGLEAVEKAEDLQPDLVLLDIGLPKLNGIEVARRIQRISPGSRVVFLTQNYSCDVTEAAIKSGAKGYVRKSAFATQLIPAVEAVLAGGEFLSERQTDSASELRTAQPIHS